ncbi:unnamed protein product [Cylindrotheca closterium]|uniref:Uncharacterized protein n=1 Tax=Cylindrotheca closterium TaxID=2856 RepID=A0AAD2JJG4_9STRA|nr:unnamed protein product [Cylindrotheca closterium]
MPTTRSGTNSTPAPTAGAANQPVSPATPTVGTTVGTPANATVQPGVTFASLDEAELLELKYNAPILDAQGVDTGQTQLTQLERPHRGTLRALLGFAYLCQNVHCDPITPINCMNIDVQAFLNYQCCGDFIVFNNSPLPQPLVSKPDRRTPADSFQKSLKLDPEAYPTLNTDEEWDSFHRTFSSTARVHNTLNVLDHCYVPKSVDERDLVQKQQVFMYTIFLHKLQTNTGKFLVQKYQETFNAQQIWAELSDHCTTSAVAETQASDLMTWLTTKRLIKSDWTGKHEAFVLNWLEQARTYNELATDKMADSQLCILLRNAIQPTPHLRQLKTNSRLLSAQTDNNYIDDSVTPDFDLDTDRRIIEVFQATSHCPTRPRLDNATWQQLDDQACRAWHQLPDAAKATILKGTSSTPPTGPPDSHLATVRNTFAPKHGELQRPMSEESDRQATVDVISYQYSDTTSPTTIVSSALPPSIRASDGVNILNGSSATQLVGTQNTMSRPTLNKRDIAHDVILDSNLEWDQTLLDPNINKLDEQGKGERPFDRVGILKSNKTILTLNEASDNETLD